MGYFGGGGGGASASGNNAWTGTNSFLDTKFSILDDVDPTKILQIQASSIAAGTTRTLTVQNANYTIAGTNLANVWTATQDISIGGLITGLRLGTDNVLAFGGGSQTGIYYNSSQTPDTLYVALGVASRSVVVADIGDVTFDFAHPLQNDPTLFVHSANASTTEWVSLTHNQTQGVLGSGKGPVALVGGSNVASAATITATGNVFHVTGTTNIDNVTILVSGTVITLIFDGILTVGDGTGNLKLTAAFVTTADDTLTLASDGTSWYEVARSIN